MSQLVVLVLYVGVLALLAWIIWLKVIKAPVSSGRIPADPQQDDDNARVNLDPREDNGVERGRLIREANRRAQQEVQEERQRRKETSAIAEARKKRQEEREAQEAGEEKREQMRVQAMAEEYAEWKGHLEDLTLEEAEVSALSTTELDDLVIAKLQKERIVHLDVLGAMTGYQSKALVDMLVRLESEGRISGVLDERGKYIYLASTKFAQMRKLVESRGRMPLNDLATLAQQLITK